MPTPQQHPISGDYLRQHFSEMILPINVTDKKYMLAAPKKAARKPALLIALATWLSCCVAATAVLTVYSHTPNEAGAARAQLTDLSAIHLDDSRPTLVMFVHPRCPCTLASVEGLARLQRKLQGRFALRVIFSVPQGMDTNWHRSTLWDNVGRLPDCERVLDPGSQLTRQAGAKTSGTVALYEPGGHLVFWGGVTSSRGHAGDSLGTDAIVNYFNNDPFPDHAQVYGCSITGPDDPSCNIESSEHCHVNDG